MKIISTLLKNKFINYFEKMFQDKELGRDDEMRYISNGKLKRIVTYVDGNVPVQYRITFLEQNPNKPSYYGKLAQKGAKIMWVILHDTETRRERWLGRVQDGTWYSKNYENNNLPF